MGLVGTCPCDNKSETGREVPSEMDGPRCRRSGLSHDDPVVEIHEDGYA